VDAVPPDRDCLFNIAHTGKRGQVTQVRATYDGLLGIVLNGWCLVCCLLLSANCLLPITRYSYIPKEIPRNGTGNLDID
jgi:hypothetical protein